LSERKEGRALGSFTSAVAERDLLWEKALVRTGPLSRIKRGEKKRVHLDKKGQKRFESRSHVLNNPDEAKKKSMICDSLSGEGGKKAGATVGR